MIKSRKELYEYLKYEKNSYRKKSKKDNLLLFLTNDHVVEIRKYISLMRKSEFYYNNRENPICMLLYLSYERRKNKKGNKLGFYICNNTFGKGLRIFHHGNIIVNGYARIGENCKLHGDNCIGNNGISNAAPVIGNNVDIGVGAKIIGDIYIADDIRIGAGAVVTKSFYEKGITIAGAPARKIK